MIKAFTGEVKLRSGPGDGVVQSDPGFAAWLTYGTEVGPDSPFAPDLVIVNEFLICGSGVDHVEGYLGLKVQMNGETHYGWTLVEVYGYLNAKTAYLRVTVKGFAYETVPGVPITTGDIGLGRFSVAPESLLEHLEIFPDLLLAKPADM